jgi:hypothetical protein
MEIKVSTTHVYDKYPLGLMRKYESALALGLVTVGAIAFGVWQHSVFAGIIGWVALTGLYNIAWAIEYGYQTDHPHQPKGRWDS